MNKDIKEKWVAALRSGKYKQGRQWLRKGDEYCCLGVLCEVLGIEAVPVMDGSDIASYDNFGGTISTLVCEEIGLLTSPAALAEMNDSGDSFDLIAQYIEDNE